MACHSPDLQESVKRKPAYAGIDLKGSSPALPPRDLAREIGRAVHLAQGFQYRAAVDRDRAVVPAVEPEGAAQRMDVAVENQADDFAVAVDHRAAGIAADDVVAGREIEPLRRVQPPLRRVP